MEGFGERIRSDRPQSFLAGRTGMFPFCRHKIYNYIHLHCRHISPAVTPNSVFLRHVLHHE